MSQYAAGPRMRTQCRPQLGAASAALLCKLLLSSGRVVAASGAANLSGTRITQIVIGSVAGALALAVLTALCCLRIFRWRQIVDLTWVKSGDVEAVAIGQTPHQPLSGPCANDLAESAHRGGGSAAAAGSGPKGDTGFRRSPCRTDTSTMTGEGQSGAAYEGSGIGGIDYAAFPSAASGGGSSGHKKGVFWGRSQGTGGVAQFFVVPKGLLRSSSGSPVKDKHLEVSRSARVEPSAEVEMEGSFQPAATNMGPPLSKSSMLLRWLNGADESLPEAAAAAAAAQATAADGAAGRGTGKGTAGRDGRAGGGRGGAGQGISLDRLPLLSLAAQQTGIVWNKMPPSLASSPAVSVVESSSMFMLKGSLKRSDAVEDTAASAVQGHSAATFTHAAAALAAWHGGDERYPASLAQASVGSYTERGAQHRGGDGAASEVGHSGIVFNYVMRGSPGRSSSRVTTAGGASSRVPTVGGGMVPTATSKLASSGGDTDRGTAHLGFGGDDAFMMGLLPNENMMEQARGQASVRTSPPVNGLSAPAAAAVSPSAGSGQAWLHQAPPMKLTALQEADGEEDDGEDATPAPRQALPTAVTQPLARSAQEQLQAAPITHGWEQTAGHFWTHLRNGEGPSAVAGPSGIPLGGAASDPPGSGDRLASEPPLPVSFVPGAVGAIGSPAAAIVGVASGVHLSMPSVGSPMLSPCDRISESELAVENVAGRPPEADCAVAGAAGGGGGGRRPLNTPTVQPDRAPLMSPGASASNLQRRLAASSQMTLQGYPSSTSLRSQTSLASPSLSMHWPEALGPHGRVSGAAAPVSCTAMSGGGADGEAIVAPDAEGLPGTSTAISGPSSDALYDGGR